LQDEDCLFEDDSDDEAQDTLLVSMLTGIDLNVQKLGEQEPYTHFGLINFANSVTIMGDG
jgi:hypothetical protein